MPNYQAISFERHAQQRWQRFSSYAFAAADTVVPLAITDLSNAVMSLPLGFIEQNEQFVPVAILGLLPGKNLFVAPDGRWVGPYVPAALRTYPFRLANTEDGQQVLCFDQDSGLVTDASEGEPLFTEDGKPTQAILEVLNLVKLIEQGRVALVAASACLRKHDLIKPWPITLKTDAGDQLVNGLFEIDEAALNQLSGEALLELRQAGALPLAYCVLLSKQHLSVLGELMGAQAKIAAQALGVQNLMKDGEFDFSFLDHDGKISFDGLN